MRAVVNGVAPRQSQFRDDTDTDRGRMSSRSITWYLLNPRHTSQGRKVVREWYSRGSSDPSMRTRRKGGRERERGREREEEEEGRKEKKKKRGRDGEDKEGGGEEERRRRSK